MTTLSEAISKHRGIECELVGMNPGIAMKIHGTPQLVHCHQCEGLGGESIWIEIIPGIYQLGVKICECCEGSGMHPWIAVN